MNAKKEEKVFDNYSFVNAKALVLFHNNTAIRQRASGYESVCVLLEWTAESA